MYIVIALYFLMFSIISLSFFPFCCSFIQRCSQFRLGSIQFTVLHTSFTTNTNFRCFAFVFRVIFLLILLLYFISIWMQSFRCRRKRKSSKWSREYNVPFLFLCALQKSCFFASFENSPLFMFAGCCCIDDFNFINYWIALSYKLFF